MTAVTEFGTAHLNLDPDAQYIERFYALVDVGPIDQCWLWNGKTNAKGYGYMGSVMATHISLWLTGARRISASYMACHRCDTPGCVNPFDLWWGTAKENWQDSTAKGRQTHLARFNANPKSAEHKANIGIALRASPKFRAHLERLHGKAVTL